MKILALFGYEYFEAILGLKTPNSFRNLDDNLFAKSKFKKDFQ